MRTVHQLGIGLPALLTTTLISIIISNTVNAFPQVAPGVQSGEGQINGPSSSPEWVYPSTLLFHLHKVTTIYAKFPILSLVRADQQPTPAMLPNVNCLIAE